MNLGHPTLQDMLKLGCKNQLNIFLAFQSYMELSEVHKAKDINYYYVPELDIIYLSATLIDNNEIYVPLSIKSSITPRWISEFRKLLPNIYTSKAIYIILCDTDTTNVIYKVNDGLERPLSPKTTKEKKEQKEKKGLIEIEITNLLPNLIKEARSRENSIMEVQSEN